MIKTSSRQRADAGLNRLAIVALLLLATALRLWGLDHDPPPYDILPDAAPWTDEGTIGLPVVEAARGNVPLGEALSDGGRPLHRLALYVTFELLGPGDAQGRLLSAFLGILGLAALAALGRSVWPRAGALLAILLAGTGFYFVAYDRLLLTEGPLIGLLLLLTLAGLRMHSRWAGFAVGAAIALLGVGFKLHALALLPAFAVFYALRRRNAMLPCLAAGAFVLLAWRLVYIPLTAPIYTAYLGDRLESEQLGLVSLGEALQQAAGAGLPAYFLVYQVPLLLLATLEVLTLLVSPRRWLQQASPVALLALAWLAGILLGNSIFRYLPPRYFHLASPPLVLLAIAGARRLWQALPFPHAAPVVQGLIAAGTGAFILFQVLSAVHISGRTSVWIAATGIALAFALFAALGGGPNWLRVLRGPLMAALLLAQLVTQGSLYARGIASSKPMLARAGSAIASALPPGSALTGRLAATIGLSQPLDTLPEIDHVSLAVLQSLVRRNGQVWLVVLHRDEFRVDPKAWPYLVQQASFPVNYSSTQQSIQLYRFNAQAALR